MRILVTGATGFIGGKVASLLRERGDEVVALVRSPAKATALVGIGCEIAQGDVNKQSSVDAAMAGCDAVIHLAARFEVGIRASESGALNDVNIGGVRHVIDSAIEAKIPRIVYASTINVFGDTQGHAVDESHKRDESKGFYSYYDSSKYEAHVFVERSITEGAPIVIVQPGMVYGPGDHFETGREILLAARGKLGMLMLADVGLNAVYIDDVADGIVKALDSGKIGESYILGGDNLKLREILAMAAAAGGKEPPRVEVPTWALKLITPIAPWITPRLGYPPNLKELIRAADNVTYWATSEKAKKDLGFSPRSFKDGLRETLTYAGIPLSPNF